MNRSLQNVKFYVYDPDGIYNSYKGMRGDCYAYELMSDGLVHEWMWLYDTQEWVETDPNNDNGDFEGRELIDVLANALMYDFTSGVVSLNDPMKGGQR